MTSRPNTPPPYSPPVTLAPNPHTSVRTALAELLARPGLPNLFIFSLANLLIQINRPPPTETPITSPPQSPSQDASTSTEPTQERFPTLIGADHRIRRASRPAQTCFSFEGTTALKHTCFSDTYQHQDLRAGFARKMAPAKRGRECRGRAEEIAGRAQSREPA